MDEAIADYSRALKLRPDLVRARFNRAVAYRLKGNLDRSLAEFDSLLETHLEYAPRLLQPRAHLPRSSIKSPGPLPIFARLCAISPIIPRLTNSC